MKTWGQVKNEALGLMFSNNSGGVKVGTDDASVQEYVINMIDAANYAIRDLSAAVPILRYFTYVQKGTDADGVMRTEMRYMTDDFRTFAPETPEMLEAGVRVGGGYIITPKRGEIRVDIPYYAYAQQIDEETEDDYDLDMNPECEDLIPIYMASRLYFEDDLAMATMYRNQYESKKAELAAKADMGMESEFISTTGWW